MGPKICLSPSFFFQEHPRIKSTLVSGAPLGHAHRPRLPTVSSTGLFTTLLVLRMAPLLLKIYLDHCVCECMLVNECADNMKDLVSCGRKNLTFPFLFYVYKCMCDINLLKM